MSPQTLYECVGDIPKCHPSLCGTDRRCDRAHNALYGAADTVTGLAFCQVRRSLAWLKANNEL